jgi:hypothetical protein
LNCFTTKVNKIHKKNLGDLGSLAPIPGLRGWGIHKHLLAKRNTMVKLGI